MVLILEMKDFDSGHRSLFSQRSTYYYDNRRFCVTFGWIEREFPSWIRNRAIPCLISERSLGNWEPILPRWIVCWSFIDKNPFFDVDLSEKQIQDAKNRSEFEKTELQSSDRNGEISAITENPIISADFKLHPASKAVTDKRNGSGSNPGGFSFDKVMKTSIFRFPGSLVQKWRRISFPNLSFQQLKLFSERNLIFVITKTFRTNQFVHFWLTVSRFLCRFSRTNIFSELQV